MNLLQRGLNRVTGSEMNEKDPLFFMNEDFLGLLDRFHI